MKVLAILSPIVFGMYVLYGDVYPGPLNPLYSEEPQSGLDFEDREQADSSSIWAADDLQKMSYCDSCPGVENAIDRCIKAKTPSIKISGDFLYWMGGVGNLPRALYQFVQESGEQQEFKMIPMDFEWGPGFRIGLVGICPNQWGVGASWTRFHNTSQGTSFSDPAVAGLAAAQYTATLKEIWGDDTSLPLGEEWKSPAKYQLKFDEVDIGLAVPIPLACAILFKPSFGFRTVILRQHFHVKEYRFDLQTNQPTFGSFVYNNKFNGYGTFAGFGTYWLMGKGFDFFTDFSGALTYGPYDKTRSTKAIPYSAINTGQFNRQNDHTILPELSLKTYINWKKRFSCRPISLNIRLGYEFHLLFNASKLWQRTNAFQLGPGNTALNHLTIWTDQIENIYLQGAVLGLDLVF